MKNQMRNYIIFGVAAVLFMSGLLVAAVSYAAPKVASANGHGTLLRLDENGNTVRRQFSFSAQERADGTVKGNAVLHNPAFSGANGNNYQLQINITCMKVYGNIAVFGGTTRRTNDPNLVDAVFFSVQDNGEPGGGRDELSAVYFWDDDPNTTGDPQACQLTGANDFPREVIEAGNIQVKP